MFPDEFGIAANGAQFFRGGLTKRELFAAMAMQGFAAKARSYEINGHTAAHSSIAWADALIRELAKTTEVGG